MRRAVPLLVAAWACTEPAKPPRPAFPYANAPKAKLGERFIYVPGTIHGYAVPITLSFRVPPGEGPLDATLWLEASSSTVGQFGNSQTESIWIEGVLSGTPTPGFALVEGAVAADVTPTNKVFPKGVFGCCRGRTGTVAFVLSDLIAGSNVPPGRLLEDGKLELVVADDTEVHAAALVVCRGACEATATELALLERIAPVLPPEAAAAARRKTSELARRRVKEGLEAACIQFMVARGRPPATSAELDAGTSTAVRFDSACRAIGF